MKTKLWMLGMAVAALTSCTQSEVVEIPESRVIGFDSFVGKNSRAANPTMTTTTLANAWVYGDYGTTTGGTYTPVDCDKNTNEHTPLFNAYLLNCNNGAYITTNQVWVASKEYRFAAYSNGNNQLQSGVTFDSSTSSSDSSWGLTFEDYEAGDHDLIATTATATTNEDLSNITSVGLSFKHLLARVQFVFNVTVGDGYKLRVKPFKMQCVRTADCTIVHPNSGDGVTWDLTSSTLGEYEFTTYSATTANTGNSSSECIITASGIYKFECYVIPQPLTFNNETLKVPVIRVETLDANNQVVSVTTFKNVDLSITGHTGWDRSTIYSYQGTIGTDAHEIIFHPTVGETWQDPDSANKSIDSYKSVTTPANS